MVNEPDPYLTHAPGDSLPDDKHPAPVPLPPRIGRYRVERTLGQGGFGLVYLGHDESLDRPVAIKVPHAHLVTSAAEAETYLAEARTVAGLEHPHIVPVYDVGSDSQFPCFVVSRYIAGADLTARLKENRFSFSTAAELVATLAEALHFAHKRGVVHRDIKPGNILLDHDGKPYLVDFGLALREESIGHGARYVGTPAYMSPEQARGEGHRVDGRSDLFSLGVLFYELLVGRRPFRGNSPAEVLDQIQTLEPRPLTQYDERIPRELQRICLKALAKRGSDRYTSAHELAEDLRFFLETPASRSNSVPLARSADAAGPKTATNVTADRTPDLGSDQMGSGNRDSQDRKNSATRHLVDSDSHLLRIVPKGLRSFDANDADFFLELLPGARDRLGLPDSLRFWKTRIESRESENSFAVGLIYGPSGCGKSSLVKAGLLPLLAADILVIYLEATPTDTEPRLLAGLRKRCPLLEDGQTLAESMAALRRGWALPAGRKVLIVIDQLEQWLHGRRDDEPAELVTALRHCDGEHLQCLVLVRDDFWMAATRLMRELELPLLEGHNSSAVDLFSVRHAEKVLAAFGRAYGALPDERSALSLEQTAFLSEAAVGLAEEGKVVCVRLALFAEMLKGQCWEPAVLRALGGTLGVGVAFLEETFSAKTAPPVHRYHQEAARAVLKSLLPESGSNIKGAKRSEQELLQASGYVHRPSDFANLLNILDNQLRLITPVDRESTSVLATSNDVDVLPHYQLTHDYLVPSLRDWLTRKQRETRKGRAELKLEERASAWNAKRENKQLPTTWEWLSIRRFTNRSKWRSNEKDMMRRATRVHLGNIFGFFTLLVIVGIVFFAPVSWAWSIMDKAQKQLQRLEALSDAKQEQERIEGLINGLLSAQPELLPEYIQRLDSSPELADSLLKLRLSRNPQSFDEEIQQLHARLAAVSRNPTIVESLWQSLLTGRDAYVGIICQQLRPYAESLVPRAWALLRDPQADRIHRFRAAVVLTDYLSNLAGTKNSVTSERLVSLNQWWSTSDLELVAFELVSSNPESQPLFRRWLRRLSPDLKEELCRLMSAEGTTAIQRLSAANAIADYYADDSMLLAKVICQSEPGPYAVLFPLLATRTLPATINYFEEVASELPPISMGTVARIELGKQRARAALTLLRLGHAEKALCVGRMSDDPEAISQFLAGLQTHGVPFERVLSCWELVRKGDRNTYPVQSRYLVLLALGEFPPSSLPMDKRSQLLETVVDWYAHDPSSGVHGAAGWLLRQWGWEEQAMYVDQTPLDYSPDREWFTLAIPRIEQGKSKNFFTFVVVPAGRYSIGSMDDEPNREPDEQWHKVEISRPFAVLDREVSTGEFFDFYQTHVEDRWTSIVEPGIERAARYMTWYESVAFCRWLTEQFGKSEASQAYADPETLDETQFPKQHQRGSTWAPREWPIDLSKPGFRLLTESEWESACRTGLRTAYSFGSDPSLLKRYGWTEDGVRGVGADERGPHPSRKLRPNLRGIFDMHGNVAEWTHDLLASHWEYDTEVDPVGGVETSYRMVRGGSTGSGVEFHRSSYRGGFLPTMRTSVGIRLAYSIVESIENKD